MQYYVLVFLCLFVGGVVSVYNEDEYIEVHDHKILHLKSNPEKGIVVDSSSNIPRLISRESKQKPGHVTSQKSRHVLSESKTPSEQNHLQEIARERMKLLSIKRRTANNHRAKRNLIIPGMNWCGVGNVSADNDALGEIAAPDRCCKEHDRCPYTIEAMTTKYNMYNYRMTTISHCECDDIFRTCLRMVSSREADIVGELFFNYLGMKCFIFKRETVCAERSWWGKCVRETTQWAAELRDPLTWDSASS